MANGRIIFFVNPDSQGVKRKGAKLGKYAPDNMDIIHLKARGLSAAFDDFAKLSLCAHDHIFIEGGDGTMSRTLGVILNLIDDYTACPKISLIAGGLTNQIASNIGLKIRRNEDITQAIKHPRKGLCPTPIVKINHGTDVHYGCLFSTGAMPFVTDYYTGKIRDSGLTGGPAIASTVIKAMSGSQSSRDKLMPATELSLTLTSDGAEKIKTGAHLGTVVTTLPSLMMGLDPFWRDDHRGFHGELRVLYADAHARRLIRNLAGLWLGRKHIERSGDGLESFEAQGLSYHYDGPCLLDGEPLSLSPNFTISATPPLPFVTGR